MDLKRNAGFALGVLTVAGLTATVSAQAAPLPSNVYGLYSTGVDANGIALSDGTLSDLHYTLLNVPAGSATSLIIRTSAGGYPIGGNPGYIGDSSTSAWIGPDNDSNINGPAGDYDYRTTFTLPSSGYVISGQWASDNVGVDILINNQPTGNFVAFGNDASGYSFEKYTPFTISSGFVAGLNTLDFIVHNDSGPTALRVDGITTAAVPELSSFASFGVLVLGLGGLMLSRKRTAASK